MSLSQVASGKKVTFFMGHCVFYQDYSQKPKIRVLGVLPETKNKSTGSAPRVSRVSQNSSSGSTPGPALGVVKVTSQVRVKGRSDVR